MEYKCGHGKLNKSMIRVKIIDIYKLQKTKSEEVLTVTTLIMYWGRTWLMLTKFWSESLDDLESSVISNLRKAHLLSIGVSPHWEILIKDKYLLALHLSSSDN